MTPPRSRPFWLAGPAEPVFAVLHEPEPRERRAGAVLLLGPFGWQDVASYRTRGAWADALAAAGTAALRIDFPGSGESAGTPRDAGLVAAWTEAVTCAARFLKDELGAASVTAVGLGLGGTLAYAAAAEGAPIDDLVLWAVPSRGRSFVRELKAFGRLQATQYGSGGVTPPDGIEAAGFFLGDDTARDLGALDCTKLALPAAARRRALLLERDGLPFDAPLAEHLEAQGVAVTHAPGPGWGAMTDTPQHVNPPLEVFGEVERWLSDGPRTGAASATPELAASADMTVGGSAIRETIFEVALPAGHLVGTFSGPRDDRGDVVVVFLNAGAVRRTGPNRLWVEAARRWAGHGVASLRLDLGAIGDSDGDAATVRETADLYSSALVDQVVATLDELEHRTRARRFVLAGLCSGGYWGFHAAVRDTRVLGATLLNAEALALEAVLEFDPEVPTVGKILRGERGRKFVRGAVGPRRLATLLFRTLRMVLRRPGQIVAGRARARELAATLDLLRDRDQRVRLIFSKHKRLHDQLGRERFLERAPDRWPNLYVEVLDADDHTFRPLAEQRVAADALDRAIADVVSRAGRAALSPAG